MAGLIGSKGWKQFMAKLYGIGAAVVITGAMFKIMHWPGAGPMLVIGLSTEVIIFFFSAFEPLHEEIDWSLVYPELAYMKGEEAVGIESEEVDVEEEEKGSLIEQLDNMLEEAKIGPELIESLGLGIQQLSDQTGKLNNITDAGVASSEFAVNMKSASQTVGNFTESYNKVTGNILNSAEQLTGSYDKAINTMQSSTEKLSHSYGKASLAMENMATSNESSQVFYGKELEKISKNLTALNASYELQLQSSNEHLKTTSTFHNGLENLFQNLNDSVEDTRKYKEQIAQLSINLESLNTVYGNMLTAMRK